MLIHYFYLVDHSMGLLETGQMIVHCVQILDTYNPDDTAMDEHFFNYVDTQAKVGFLFNRLSRVCDLFDYHERATQNYSLET